MDEGQTAFRHVPHRHDLDQFTDDLLWLEMPEVLTRNIGIVPGRVAATLFFAAFVVGAGRSDLGD